MVATSPNAVVICTGITTGPVAVALMQSGAEPSGHADQWKTAGRAVVETTCCERKIGVGQASPLVPRASWRVSNAGTL